MWFTRAQFEICSDLKAYGLEPRFEPGDVVARGFADLGFEEFQVLPGPKLLSLTAGTTSALPNEHRQHFFWVPSVDESVAILEQAGIGCLRCEQLDRGEWRVEAQRDGELEAQSARSLSEALLRTVHAVYKERYRRSM